MAEVISFLSRAQILEAKDIAEDTVAVPEWGGSVKVRALTGAERDQYEAQFVRFDRKGNRQAPSFQDIRAKLVAMSCIDEQGQRLFTDADIVQLSRKSAAALQRVFEACQRLSGLTEQDVEDLTKN